MKIYVASSWRNATQPTIVGALRCEHYDVYDFRHPEPGDDGFSWSDVDPRWQSWTLQEFKIGLGHSRALEGFCKDRQALDRADVVVLVLPCGRSAHLEAGYAVGSGKPLAIFFGASGAGDIEPELMYSWAEVLTDDIPTLLLWARTISKTKQAPGAGEETHG